MLSDKFKKINIKSTLYSIFIGKSVPRKIFMFYLYTIVVGIILLSLPISFKNPGSTILNSGEVRKYDFIDSLFVTVSAFTDTGLTPLDVVETYSIFGQVVVVLLIQIGGLGLFTLYWLFWNFLFNNIIYKKIKKLPLHASRSFSFSNSLLIASERGNTKLGLSIKSIKSALIFIIVVELIFAMIYSLMFYYIPSYKQVDITSIGGSLDSSLSNLKSYQWYVDGSEYNYFYRNPGLSIWSGIFQSVSTMNNAGFDIEGNASYSTFRNGVWTIFLYLSIIQIIIGGIGYPVIYDLLQYFKLKYYHQKFRFSLFTKVSTITYFIVFFVGVIFLISFEYGIPREGLISTVHSTPALNDVYFGKDPNLRTWNEVTSLIFNVATARSAGISTFSQTSLSYGSVWIMNILMFIGCAPSSTGGGIRTTALAIVIMTAISYMRGRDKTIIFKKVIPSETVMSSSVIILTSAFLVLFLSFISFPFVIAISPAYDHLTITDVIFEFASAYGTVGLSTGLTSILQGGNFGSYFVASALCLVMIIGQLGIPTTIFAFKSKKSNKLVSYAQEDIKV